MIYFIALLPIFLLLGGEIALIVRQWKKNEPAKSARVFAIVAVVCGAISLACQFFPFEYNGPSGIDYIGQALVWAAFVKGILAFTLVLYADFAVVATVFAVRAMMKKETRKSGAVCLVVSWIYGLVAASLIVTNIVSDRAQQKSIKVNVAEVTQTVDSDGEPSVIVSIELFNGSKNEIYYLGSVYDEVTQGGKELSHALIPEMEDYRETDIEKVKPGSTLIVKKGYKLKSADEPIKFYFSNYARNVVYCEYSCAVPHKKVDN